MTSDPQRHEDVGRSHRLKQIKQVSRDFVSGDVGRSGKMEDLEKILVLGLLMRYTMSGIRTRDLI